MLLDIATLTIVSIIITVLAGALLMFSWWQNRNVPGLACWGASLVVAAVGLGMLTQRGRAPGWLTIGMANAVIFAAYGLFWSGFRIFERRRAHLMPVLAGALVWSAACGIPEFYKSFPTRVGLASVLIAAYMLAAAWEIWRGRTERLMSRYPVAILLLAHAGLTLLRYPTITLWRETSEATVFSTPWIAAHSFETLIFTVTSAFLLLGITKERIDREQRLMASREPLTGILNRRAFLDAARSRIAKAPRQDEPAALILADIDRFREINDRFGHDAGDEVLRTVCRIAAGIMPDTALLGRLGSDEFAIVLPGASEADAAFAAEALREAVAAVRFQADGFVFHATASTGLATTGTEGSLEGLVRAAGAALSLDQQVVRDRSGGDRRRVRTDAQQDGPRLDEDPTLLAA